jgi:hypothetical protein
VRLRREMGFHHDDQGDEGDEVEDGQEIFYDIEEDQAERVRLRRETERELDEDDQEEGGAALIYY